MTDGGAGGQKVFAWGSDIFGQLGIGTGNSADTRKKDRPITPLVGVRYHSKQRRAIPKLKKGRKILKRGQEVVLMAGLGERNGLKEGQLCQVTNLEYNSQDFVTVMRDSDGVLLRGLNAGELEYPADFLQKERRKSALLERRAAQRKAAVSPSPVRASASTGSIGMSPSRSPS